LFIATVFFMLFSYFVAFAFRRDSCYQFSRLKAFTLCHTPGHAEATRFSRATPRPNEFQSAGRHAQPFSRPATPPGRTVSLQPLFSLATLIISGVIADQAEASSSRRHLFAVSRLSISRLDTTRLPAFIFFVLRHFFF